MLTFMVYKLQMLACARGHKDAMLTLNQWNPLALLGLANRFASSTSGHVTSVGREWFEAGTSLLASNNDYHIGRGMDASSSSSPPPGQTRDIDGVSQSWVDIVSRTAELSATVNLPFHSPPHPTIFPRGDTPTESSFSPTELLSVSHKGLSLIECQGEHELTDSDESQLFHLEQSVTISYTDERPTSDSKKRTARLKKRTSVDILPSYVQRRTNTPKISKTASVGDSGDIPAELTGSPDTWPTTALMPGELRVSNSDSHLSGLSKLHSSAGGPDPMISMIDHDINSPQMMFTSDAGGEILAGFPMDSQPAAYILPCESMAVDIGM